MRFSKPTADLFIPDGLPHSNALARTTHLAIGAHPDDLEIMALEGILACFGNPDKWFCGVVVTHGAGSARTGPYARFTDEEMKAIRREEQTKAAIIGEYGAQIMLDYSSQEIRDPTERGPVADIRT